MLGQRNLVLVIAILGGMVILSSSNSVHHIRTPKQITNVSGDYEENERTTEKPKDITTKEFRLPLCALPKKGPLICYVLCVLSLNDRGTCKPNNICSCTIEQALSPGSFFSLLGK